MATTLSSTVSSTPRQVDVGGKTYVLRRGDAIAFDSSVPHRFANTGKEVVRTLWVNVHGNRWST